MPVPVQRGFTLIELLIAMGIIAILASLAWPSWTRVLHHARRTEAHIALARIQHAQESYYINHLQYAAQLQGGAGLGLPETSESGDYFFRMHTSSDGQFYRITATAQGRQQQDHACRELSVDTLGQRQARDAAGQPAPKCW